MCGFSIIKGLRHDIHVDKIHKWCICFILELHDKRIATCGYDNSISIVSLNYYSKKWKQDIKKKKAHSNSIYGLCELSNSRLVSCSFDRTIKIWRITTNDLKLLSTLTNHTDRVMKVVTLNYNRFASCSLDETVKIWNSEYPYQLISSLQHDGKVFNLLKLKQKDILITSVDGYPNPDSIHFWNANNYKKLHSIKGYSVSLGGNPMIELPNGLVAISSLKSIIIVDPTSYTIIKEIKEEGYITWPSSLCVLDTHSFIYVYDGNVVQISIGNNYRILYSTKGEQQLHGWGGLISVKGGEYLIVTNRDNQPGLEVVKPYY